MLELRFIRENLELVKEKTEFRGVKDSRVEDFAAVDIKRRELLTELESLQTGARQFQVKLLHSKNRIRMPSL
jgi:seryl-tRNA synthetase